MVTSIRLMILFFCLLGYFLLLESKGIPTAFCPFLVIAGISIVLFAAGILNFMLLAVLILILGGYLGGIYAIFRSIAKCPPPRRHFFIYVLWSLAFFLFWVRLQNAVPSHYDNFSHWMLIVSDMTICNQLPSFHSNLIDFRSYPPGSACVIYFFCKTIGTSEPAMVFAQAMMSISCLTFMCYYVKGNRILSFGVLILSWIYILSSNIAVTDLPVDTLLPCVALASAALLMHYQDSLSTQAVINGICGTFLLLIKNSGIFFILLNLVLPFFVSYISQPQHRLHYPRKSFARYFAVSVSLPAAAYFLWSRHTAYVFPALNGNKHAMSLSNYYSVLSSKSTEDLSQFFLNFLRRLFTPDVHLLVIAIIALVYCLHWILTRQTPNWGQKTVRAYAYWSIFSLCLYIIGLAAMYIFSMPKGEAGMLSSYDRYFQTILQYIAGIFGVYLLQWLGCQSSAPTACLYTAPIAIILVLCTSLQSLPNLFYLPSSNAKLSGIRHELDSLTEEYQIPDHHSYFFITEDSSDFIYYLAKYTYRSRSVSFASSLSAEQLSEVIDTFDYLIVMCDPKNVSDMLAEAGLPTEQKVYALEQFR